MRRECRAVTKVCRDLEQMFRSHDRHTVRQCRFIRVVGWQYERTTGLAHLQRGGEGTANPDLDRPALSISLDRDDITYLVADYLERLEPSVFWQQTVKVQ